MVRFLGLLLLIMSFMSTCYAGIVQPMQPQQAFIFSSEFVAPSTIITKFTIAPGYYLYRDRFTFTTKPTAIVNITYPATNVDFDKKTARYEGYTGKLVIPVEVKQKAKNIGKTILHVTYQGCAEQGFCYPPMSQDIPVSMSAAKVDISQAEGLVASVTAPNSDASNQSLTTIVKDQNIVNHLLSSSQHEAWVLLIFVGLGLLLAFTPCVLPMIPILTGIIVGQGQKVSTTRALALSVSYVLGASTAYAMAGVVAALMGSSLQVWFQQPVFIITGAVIFLLLALSLFGLFELTLPAFINRRILHMSNRHQGGAYVGVFFMGVFSALLVSPCVTAPLVGVLLYIAATGNVWLGGSALFALGIGMGLPLILIGVTAGKWLPRRGPWMEGVKKLFGVIMLMMAAWIVSRIATLSFVLLLYGALLVISSVLIGVHLPRHIGWHKVNRTIGAITGIIGVIFMMLAFNTSAWMSVIGHSTQKDNTIISSGKFVTVRTQQELANALAAARLQNKPVLLDFYADWCQSCIEMEKNVFSLDSVQADLKNFVMLRADLTDNDAEDQALLQTYKVIAPPTVLLFNPRGKEQDNLRIVGAVSAQEFKAQIGTFARANCDRKAVC